MRYALQCDGFDRYGNACGVYFEVRWNARIGIPLCRRCQRREVRRQQRQRERDALEARYEL